MTWRQSQFFIGGSAVKMVGNIGSFSYRYIITYAHLVNTTYVTQWIYHDIIAYYHFGAESLSTPLIGSLKAAIFTKDNIITKLYIFTSDNAKRDSKSL